MAHPDSTIVNDRFARRLALVYSGFFLNAGWQVPLFPVWLSSRGLDPAAIGLVLASMQAIRVVATPAGTRLADRHGALNQAIVVAASASVCAVAVLGSVSGSPLIVAAALLFSFAAAPLLPLIDAYGLMGLRLHARSYGPVRLWGSVAYIVANLTGGVLLGLLAKPQLVWLIFTGQCVIALAALMLVRLPRGARKEQASGRSHLRQPAFLAIAAAGSLIQASHAVYYVIATLDWTQKGFAGMTIGVLWALGVVAEIALFALSARLPAWVSPVVLILIGAAGAIVRWIVTAMNPPFALLAPLQLLHALSFGATHLGTMMFLMRSAPEEGRAAAQGDLATANTLVMAAASALAGALYGANGSLAYLAMAALAVLGAGCALVAARLIQPHNAGVAG